MEQPAAYWVAAATSSPPVPASPAAATPRSWLLPLVAVGVSVLALAAGVGAASARQPAPPDLHQVLGAAPASQGWSPAWLDDRGRPARWDPCAPVHYVLNPAWAPASGRADLDEALARLSAVSGLQFVDDGETDEVPTRDRAAYQPERYGDRWAPVLVAWVPPSATDLGLGNGIQGLTTTTAVPGARGGAIVTGQVALDAGHRLARGFGPGTTEGEVLLHELAHLVGLGHVDDPTQVMYVRTTNSESTYGAGDRAGLQALGARAGCLPAPRPRPLG